MHFTPLKGKFQPQNNNTVQNKGLQVKQSSQQRPSPCPIPLKTNKQTIQNNCLNQQQQQK